ncbi:MAG: ABC transporter permease [Patescibacteria group bacterium]|nr:ABC transporter permease [Patescibacteria group bacterium]MDE2116294.1 ABC transporter permease [Patescibacteria group bacterium]
MRTVDLFEETYTALTANKVRTGLTMLGIIIGIASVIAMTAIGAGAQNSVQASIQSIGSNLVLVMPGAQKGPGYQVSAGRGSARTLTREDATALASGVSTAQEVAPDLSGRYQITAKGTNTNTTVDGVTAAYPDVRNVQIDTGSFISDANDKDIAKVAVLGPTAMQDLFGTDADPTQVIGQNIRIKGYEFTVIGVTKAKGGSGFGSQDDMVFIPLSTAERYFAGADYVTTISIQAVNAQSMTQLQNDVTDLLLQRHNISDPTQADFTVLNQADIVATASSVTNTFTLLLAAVAGISLVVGGIGIMNMMLTTVTERTREIGLRKAIGAKKRDINLQFLVEAIVLTFIGGAVGVGIGWLIAFGLSSLGILQAQVSMSSVLLAFGVSAAIGIVFGYYPARRASELNPIEALRYE